MTASRQTLLANLPGVSDLCPGTALGAGINSAITELTSSRHRANAERLVILLTDGVSNATGDDPLGQALQLRQLGIELIMVGLGPNVSASTLQAMASSPIDYYPAGSASELASVFAT